jgi:hypothetical protein
VTCKGEPTHTLPNGNKVCDEHFKEYELFKKCGLLEPGVRIVPFSEFTDDEKKRALELARERRGLS